MRYISKKESNFRKTTFILFLISLIICFSVIKNTYAKYITQASGDANIQIARWKILVNNQDIQKNNELSSVIKPVFEGTDDIASGVIAPTAKGYFDIIIDATNTDVSFSYEITTSKDDNSSVSDIILSGYSIDDGEINNTLDENGQLKLKENILYNQEKRNFKLRVYLIWNDDTESGATMDNEADTNATTTDTNLAKIKVNVKFIQLKNTTPTE